ncbi:MAG: excinuclease ABC subunit UvrC [Bacteroidia bacterium]|nr:excinuclease ABC subunit UvrC [Bacteroidia bacterium]
MTIEDYRSILPTLPKEPGVYKYLDKDDKILYVGKAKNLKSRISSYFGAKKHLSNKTRTLVKNAHRIEYIIVQTEQDALLLENTLIKKFQPRYNIQLKDAKSYSYVCIKKERFPRVFITRNVIRDGSLYYGPYTSKARLKIILDLIKNLFPLRTCNFYLSQSNIDKGKFKVCLEYHIKNCEGPCENLESEDSYNAKVKQIKNILRGNFGPVKSHFKNEMVKLGQDLAFEKAQIIKEKLSALEDYQHKSTVVSQSIKDVDVFTLASDEEEAYVNYIKVINGAIINTHTAEFTKNLDRENPDLLTYAIPVIREKFNSIAPEILVNLNITNPVTDAEIIVPQRGDKLRLLELSQKNVQYYLFQKKKEALGKIRKQTTAERILNTMKEDLHMERLPLHIECFDNSNIQGSNPVASCVVFKNAKPSKKDYRHFHIKTVEGPNDFASMEEVVRRRYARLLKDDEALPQLVIIDGGKGQLSAAHKIIKEIGLEDKIQLVGIAKKLEEIFFPEDPIPLYINKKSESLKLIQQLRNEAHRFAITFHRDMRSKNFLNSELESISGIGPKTIEKLIRKFKSVSKIRKLDLLSLQSAIGKAAGKKVFDYFDQESV